MVQAIICVYDSALLHGLPYNPLRLCAELLSLLVKSEDLPFEVIQVNLDLVCVYQQSNELLSFRKQLLVVGAGAQTDRALFRANKKVSFRQHVIN